MVCAMRKLRSHPISVKKMLDTSRRFKRQLLRIESYLISIKNNVENNQIS